MFSASYKSLRDAVTMLTRDYARPMEKDGINALIMNISYDMVGFRLGLRSLLI